MDILALMIIFNLIVLLIGVKTQKFLYTVTPEAQWKEALDEFDSNLEALKKIDLTNTYKLGEDHIY